MRETVPFNKPFLSGSELDYIARAHDNGQLAGDGPFTKLCEDWICNQMGAKKVLLTHSCTAALEMAALLLDLRSGDEVILPSFTFVSTANAIVLRGATPVFVDICCKTQNIDPSEIEAAITERTKAIFVVHYAGVSSDMNIILEIASAHKLYVVEDAAQGVLSEYNGRPLGSMGHLGTVSFHETKNVISGEGGALIINDEALADRAEIIREKGTNRKQFFRGQVDKYTWTDIGSSYLPGEIIAAFLYAQLENAQAITERRLEIWSRYDEGFASLGESRRVELPHIPESCKHNAHMYYLLLKDINDRTRFIEHMRSCHIQTVFHYVPLHSTEFARKVGLVSGDMNVTDRNSERLVRLPLWLGLEPLVPDVISSALSYLSR